MRILRNFIAATGLLAGMALSAPLLAAQFCVDSADGLRAAVITGQILNEFVDVRVVQGNYNLPGGFGGQYTDVRYTNNLTISSGWTAGCNTRSMNPALTTINGQNHANSGWEINSSASITIEGLRLYQMQRLRLGNSFVSACQPGASINVRRTMIQNAGDTQFGALNIWGDCHQTRVENNLITGAAGNGIYYYCTGDSSPPSTALSTIRCAMRATGPSSPSRRSAAAAAARSISVMPYTTMSLHLPESSIIRRSSSPTSTAA